MSDISLTWDRYPGLGNVSARRRWAAFSWRSRRLFSIRGPCFFFFPQEVLRPAWDSRSSSPRGLFFPETPSKDEAIEVRGWGFLFFNRPLMFPNHGESSSVNVESEN